ncbi:mucin-2 [Streptomyces sp. NPDC020298]|uniref:PP2C family protein-serine/threonine phosphatase n=1 Tax=unclassified Streptomyces TaxID=2593676 RepID=UPI0033EAC483
MRTYATAQLIGDCSHQCDATATYTAPSGAQAFVLCDGIGSNDAVRRWTRAQARRLAVIAARKGDAETGLRSLYNHIAAQRAQRDPWTRDEMPKACALVAVTAPDRPMTVAWCGDVRAYVLVRGTVQRLTADHNLRRVWPPRNGRPGGNRNRITSCLGAIETDEETMNLHNHPAIESVTRGPEDCRLLLASDGAYEPHEDAGHQLAKFLIGDVDELAEAFVDTAVATARAVPDPYADNATALIADIRTAA